MRRDGRGVHYYNDYCKIPFSAMVDQTCFRNSMYYYHHNARPTNSNNIQNRYGGRGGKCNKKRTAAGDNLLRIHTCV